jgi:FixJ family two-component response regulator
VVDPPLTVYIVDDDAAIRRALVRLMRSAGLAAEAFASVQALLVSPRTLIQPSKGVADQTTGESIARACVVADIRMPGQSGLELPALLAKQGLSLPVIFITAYDTEEHRKAAHAVGAAAFFRKPVDGEALLDAIHWAVEIHSSPAGTSRQRSNNDEE